MDSICTIQSTDLFLIMLAHHYILKYKYTITWHISEILCLRNQFIQLKLKVAENYKELTFINIYCIID